MAQGLQIWDENGNLVFDTNDRITKVLGSIAVQNSGSAPFIILQGNTPFFIFAPTSWDIVNLGVPSIGVQNGQITWTYPSGINPMPGILTYGMF